MRTLCQQSLSAALLFWSQRLAVEFLVQSRTARAASTCCPTLTLERAATTLYQGAHAPLQTRRRPGLAAAGQLCDHGQRAARRIHPCRPGATGSWPSGLGRLAQRRGWLAGRACAPVPELLETATARIRVENTWFREDEWLGDASHCYRVSPVAQALGVIYHALLSTSARSELETGPAGHTPF
jgi:hypothetical protein